MVELQCPVCKSEILITDQKMMCSNNHTFFCKNGVYKLMEKTSLEKLDNYLEKFEHFRASQIQNINASNVNNLPNVDFDKDLWKLRVQDLKIITSLIGKQKQLDILDVGAWNGWLSHNLAKLKNDVIAIDYFTAAFDGLETVTYYKDKFLAIQAPIEHISIFKSKFDIIILNRCFPYFKDQKKQIKSLQKMLKDNGILIITGISLTNNPKRIQSHLEKTDKTFKKKYNTSLFIVPFKGYTDKEDLAFLKKRRFVLKRYKRLLLKSFLSKIKITEVDYLYAIYRKPI
ncbi:methyltransferase domain-containing protein [Aquimarina sp. RZ0]|uniref:methyltransferase domain-containing protein n=1 Tax=Aquimarina sp. RZ0 TaxID=2607730 RepID=UPI0011F1AA06|nr:methyltransferase domain-containing protein [Aquimarina sp. RZ0]KAA1244141.1 methyltransferase domain-containing protein [Aquimarina sp. RZ0]